MNVEGGFALLSYHQGCHGEGWCIPDTVSAVHIVEEARALELAAARSRNHWRCAVIPWGPDVANRDLSDEPNEPLIDNYRVRQALGLPVKWFKCEDDGATWWVVAVNIEHAKEILRRNCDAFGQDGVSYDKADLEWSELTAEQAAKVTRCHRETRDGKGEVVPLNQCYIGDAFCSEW